MSGAGGAAGPIFVGTLSFALGAATLLPGVAYWDTGEFQTVGPLLGTAHPTGFPSYVILGWLASIVLQPLGEPALRMNLLSALAVGAGSGALVVLVRRLTGHDLIAVATGFAFAVGQIVWGISNHADPHALHLALVAVLLVLLVGWEAARRSAPKVYSRADRWLVGAALVYGVALANHTLTALLALPIAVFVTTVDPGLWRRARLVARCAAVLILTTALLYLELPIRAAMHAPQVYGHPDTWSGFWYVVLGQQFQGTFVNPLTDLGRTLGELRRVAELQFGPLVVALPFAFLATVVRRPRYALLSGLGFLITCLFAVSYENAEIERYYLGPALLGASWLGILAGWLTDLGQGRLAIRGEVSLRAATLVEVAMAAAMVAPLLPLLPDRAAAVDQRRNDAAARWSTAALAAFEPDAVVLSWWSYSTPLWYAQRVEGRRPDIAIVDDRTLRDQDLGGVRDVIDANLGRRPVYLIRLPQETSELFRDYDLEPVVSLPIGQEVLRVNARRELAP